MGCGAQLQHGVGGMDGEIVQDGIEKIKAAQANRWGGVNGRFTPTML